jgi:hypothetical protein
MRRRTAITVARLGLESRADARRESDAIRMSLFAWWVGLCVVSVLNLCAWWVAAARLRRTAASSPREEVRQRRWQLALSGIYVVGCGFRSWLPRADVQRICLFDTWLSSVMVGRWVATFAELAFAAQWALLLTSAARACGDRYAMLVGYTLLPLIVFAELNSWYAVLTTNFLGNAIEQSSWMLAGVLLASALISVRRRLESRLQMLTGIGVALALLFVVFMCSVDIPMYVGRWLSDVAQQRPPLSLRQGAWDAARRWVVTWDERAWHGEQLWMSLYFSAGVWISVALSFAPRAVSSMRQLRASR